jgi:hypothetical protein
MSYIVNMIRYITFLHHSLFVLSRGHHSLFILSRLYHSLVLLPEALHSLFALSKAYHKGPSNPLKFFITYSNFIPLGKLKPDILLQLKI